MTQDRIQYFEKVLSKPQPEPFKSWLEELFGYARNTTTGDGTGKKLPKFNAGKVSQTMPIIDDLEKHGLLKGIDTIENTDA